MTIESTPPLSDTIPTQNTSSRDGAASFRNSQRQPRASHSLATQSLSVDATAHSANALCTAAPVGSTADRSRIASSSPSSDDVAPFVADSRIRKRLRSVVNRTRTRVTATATREKKSYLSVAARKRSRARAWAASLSARRWMVARVARSACSSLFCARCLAASKPKTCWLGDSSTKGSRRANPAANSWAARLEARSVRAS
mmetsp:Transcript_629/g.1791  ORF Transcript_629/g.1791 Transcript_629/m.1791 type:complete len:200 (-) Transcript_629:223-822(-)